MAVQNKVLVSVVVVNYNRRELLRAALMSLQQQADVKFETILVDNGSSDGSVEMAVQEFGTEPSFPFLVIVNKDNKGFCAANNQGIAQASGEFVALLNNDAEAQSGWLAALVSGFEGRPEIGMAASKILVYEDPARIDKAGHLIYPDGQNRGRGSGELDRGQFDQTEEVLWPDGCAAMYRKAMLDEIGGFDEDLFAYADDAELGMRARMAGWRCIYVPSAVVRHHRGMTLGVRSSRRLVLIERNRILLAVKHFPLRLLIWNGFYFGLRVLASAWSAFQGRGEAGRFPGISGKLLIVGALARGNWEALALIPKTLRKRWAFRSQRRLTAKETLQLLERYRISLREISEQTI